MQPLTYCVSLTIFQARCSNRASSEGNVGVCKVGFCIDFFFLQHKHPPLQAHTARAVNFWKAQQRCVAGLCLASARMLLLKSVVVAARVLAHQRPLKRDLCAMPALSLHLAHSQAQLSRQ